MSSPTAPPSRPSQQLSLTLESVSLRGLSAEDRARAVAVLAGLLMEAAALVVPGDPDDER